MAPVARAGFQHEEEPSPNSDMTTTRFGNMASPEPMQRQLIQSGPACRIRAGLETLTYHLECQVDRHS